MLRLLALFLPVLMPSWQFFREVGPSPRIQFRVTRAGEETPWRPYWPWPDRVPLGQMLRRMLWNPGWNEHLFLVSCAERLVVAPSQHSVDEIAKRIAHAIGGLPPGACLEFRLIFVQRLGDEITPSLDYQSARLTPADIPP